MTRTIEWPENTVHANDEIGRRPGAGAAVGHRAALRAGVGSPSCIVEVAEHTGAQVVVTLGAMPSQVPHSRMPLVHASSANPEIAQRFGLARPRYQGITGIVGTLQAELDHLDVPAISMQVGVPYYAAGAQNWKASAALLRNLEHVTGIPTGHGLLQERVAEWEQLVDDAVAENPEASGYLPQLEAEYDRQATEQLPSSDDLAAEFERYLRELDDPPALRRVAHRRRRSVRSSRALLALVATARTRAATGSTVQRRGRSCAARSLGEVAFATTHNSMASSAERVRAAEPARGLRGPARARHPRLPDRRVLRHAARRSRVHRPLRPARARRRAPRAAVRAAASCSTVASARRPRAPPYDVYLCHVFCELGAVRMLDEMQRGARVPRRAPARGAGDGDRGLRAARRASAPCCATPGSSRSSSRSTRRRLCRRSGEMIDAGHPSAGVARERRRRPRRCPTRSPAWCRRRRSRSAGPATSERPSSCADQPRHRRRARLPVQPLGHAGRAVHRRAG